MNCLQGQLTSQRDICIVEAPTRGFENWGEVEVMGLAAVCASELSTARPLMHGTLPPLGSYSGAFVHREIDYWVMIIEMNFDNLV